MKHMMKWLTAVAIALTLSLVPVTAPEALSQEPCDATCVNVPEPPEVVCVVVGVIVVVDADGNVLGGIAVIVCTTQE